VSAFENATVLELGARGKLRGAPFTLVGRTCVKSASGGVWNEWTARFDDGRVAFLAEARGSFTLFFERPLAGAWDALTVGAPLDTGYCVTERGEATRVLRWGETFDAPKTYRYADLSSRTGETATVDYGEAEPRTFVGTRVTLKALGLTPRAQRPSFVPVTASRPPKGLALCLAIGDEGTLDGAKYRVLGVLHRSVRIEGERYTWEEYVLHEASQGLRWLVVSDGHWNLVESVEPGLVTETERGATFEGESYKPWSEGTARVEWAGGELPWAVVRGNGRRDLMVPRDLHAAGRHLARVRQARLAEACRARAEPATKSLTEMK
jgi:Domain of unknown function (DUF4178)